MVAAATSIVRERDEALAAVGALREAAQVVVDDILHSTIDGYHRNGPTWTIRGEVGEVFTVSTLLDREEDLRALDAALTSTSTAAAARDAALIARGRREGIEAVRERVAQAIYDAVRAKDPEGSLYPWVVGGNAVRQDDAREMADRALSTPNEGGPR
jgi:hypothetical protein